MKKFFLLASFTLGASIASGMELSFNDAIDLIQSKSHDLEKAKINLEKAKAGVDLASSSKWFKLDASASYMHAINVERPGTDQVIDTSALGLNYGILTMPDNLGVVGLSLTQPIYTFGRIKNALIASNHAMDIADLSILIAKNEIRFMASKLYWSAKMTDEIVKITKNNLEASISAKEQITSAGRSNRGNLVKILADIATKEVALSDALFNRDSAHRMLKIMTEIDLDEKLVLTSVIPKQFKELTVNKELDKNLEWDLLSSQISMYKAKEEGHKAENYPIFAASASYNYITFKDDAELWNGSNKQSASIGLALSIPIFNGGATKANIKMDHLTINAAYQDLEKSKKMKSNEYQDAVSLHKRLRDNLAKLETAKDLAIKAAQFSMERFTTGQTSAVELSDVQSAVMQVEMGILSTKINILMTEESVQKLSGR